HAQMLRPYRHLRATHFLERRARGPSEQLSPPTRTCRAQPVCDPRKRAEAEAPALFYCYAEGSARGAKIGHLRRRRRLCLEPDTSRPAQADPVAAEGRQFAVSGRLIGVVPAHRAV